MHASMLAPADEPLFAVHDPEPVFNSVASPKGPECSAGNAPLMAEAGSPDEHSSLHGGLVCGFYAQNGYHCFVPSVNHCVVCKTLNNKGGLNNERSRNLDAGGVVCSDTVCNLDVVHHDAIRGLEPRVRG